MLGFDPFFAEPKASASYFLLPLVGIFAGFVAALFGVGGGTVFVPFLNIFFGFSMHNAVATSLASIIGTSLFGVFFHKEFSNINFGIVKMLAPACVLGAIAGALSSWFFDSTIL